MAAAQAAAPPAKDDVLQLLSGMKLEIDTWYQRSLEDLNKIHTKTNDRIEMIRRQMLMQQQGSQQQQLQQAPMTPPRRRVGGVGGQNQHQQHEDPFDASSESAGWGADDAGRGGGGRGGSSSVLATPNGPNSRPTPTGSPQQGQERVPLDRLLNQISGGGSGLGPHNGGANSNNNATSPPINFDSLYEQLTGGSSERNSPVQDGGARPPPGLGGGGRGGGGYAPPNATIPIDSIMQLKGQSQTTSHTLSRVENGRPVVTMPNASAQPDDPGALGIDPMAACRVLVEFKRKRVLQFESRHYVGPGEYVVVGGDRGEDVGLVIYTWAETNARGVQGIGLAGSSLTKSIGVGSGKVLRVASGFDVTQLHGMQAELEKRAVEVCTSRVLEHGLPMIIVDAEYQFDKKKLTFFYEAQQRLDFRELVRDLFKAFRARIWMEAVEN